MDDVLFLKILLSFFVGGTVIATLGWWAEHADRKIAGVVIFLPSTVVISYFFIGWTSGIQAVVAAVPATVVTAAAVQCFTIAYYYLSQIPFGDRRNSLAVSITGALSAWFFIAVPIAHFRFSNLPLAIVAYIISVIGSYYLLTVRNIGELKHERLIYSHSQKIGRAVFAGSIISLAVVFTKILSPFWGGAFSTFPAVFTSTFLLLHWYHGHDMLAKVMKKIPLGSAIYVIYVITCLFTFPRFGLVGGTIVSYTMCLVLFGVYY